MPDQIKAQAAILRPVNESDLVQEDLRALIARFAKASLYTNTGVNVKNLRAEIIKRMARKYLPFANEVGRASAAPVLKILGGTELVDKGNALRGTVLSQLRTRSKRTLLAFRAELARETGGLSGEIEASFARALRDGVAKKQLIADLAAADTAEMSALKDARRAIRRATGGVEDAERAVARAGKRARPKAMRTLRAARKDLTKAKRNATARRSFLARFENKVNGHVRDNIRREAQEAQVAVFRQAGFKVFTWISVNGSESCPTCQARHGETRTWQAWRGDAPGDGTTLCGESCQCQLIPEPYFAGNPALAEPVNLFSESEAPKAAEAV